MLRENKVFTQNLQCSLPKSALLTKTPKTASTATVVDAKKNGHSEYVDARADACHSATTLCPRAKVTQP